MLGLRTEIVGGDNEHGVWLGIGHVDDAKVPAGTRPAKGHAGVVGAWTILERPPQDVANLTLTHPMACHVGFARLWVKVEADDHAGQFARMRLTGRPLSGGPSSARPLPRPVSPDADQLPAHAWPILRRSH